MIRKSKIVGVTLMLAVMMTLTPLAVSANGIPKPEVIQTQTPQGIAWEKVLSSEDLAGRAVVEKYKDLQVVALTVVGQRWLAAFGTAHITSPTAKFYEPIYHLFGVWLSDDGGVSWQKLPNPPDLWGYPITVTDVHLVWEGEPVIAALFFPGGLRVFNEHTRTWHRILSLADYLKHPAGQIENGRTGWFAYIIRNDPVHPVTYEPRGAAQDPLNVAPPTEKDGLFLCWDRGEAKLLLPTQIKPAYVSVSKVTRAEKATQLYVKIIEGESRYLLGDVWRVTIPDTILQDPSLLLPVTLTLQIGSPELIVERNGERTIVVLDAVPEIKLGWDRTFLPIRPAVEALGGQIYWDGKAMRVDIEMRDRKISLWIGERIALVDGVETPIDSNPLVRPYIAPPGRTMLPLRFITEALGAEVLWDGDTWSITIIYPHPKPMP